MSSPPLNITLRHEQPEDAPAIHQVNLCAFAQPAEADLVDRLRDHGKVTLSLVAVKDAEIVGHILFSPVHIEANPQALKAVGLAPMAVAPALQRQGVGSRLVAEGLDECRRLGVQIVVVLGHPHFYPRFGFAPASRFRLRSQYDVADEVFMALQLAQGALQQCAGTVSYQPEFDDL